MFAVMFYAILAACAFVLWIARTSSAHTALQREYLMQDEWTYWVIGVLLGLTQALVLTLVGSLLSQWGISIAISILAILVTAGRVLEWMPRRVEEPEAEPA